MICWISSFVWASPLRFFWIRSTMRISFPSHSWIPCRALCQAVRGAYTQLRQRIVYCTTCPHPFQGAPCMGRRTLGNTIPMTDWEKLTIDLIDALEQSRSESWPMCLPIPAGSYGTASCPAFSGGWALLWAFRCSALGPAPFRPHLWGGVFLTPFSWQFRKSPLANSLPMLYNHMRSGM